MGERAVSSAVIPRGLVASLVLVRLTMRVNITGFNDIMLPVVGDVPVDTKVPVGDFVNLEDLPVQSSKMLIEVIFVYATLIAPPVMRFVSESMHKMFKY
jgi:hypothetical protein